MRNQPVPLPLGFYRDEDRPFSQQDVWNYLPCKSEAQGTRSSLMLKTPPGLYPWLEIDGAPPVRGIHDCEGRLYAVIGTTLYRLSATQVAIPIGTIPGNGRVSMDHNQRSRGQQLTVVNGSAGYVLDTNTGDFGKITDPGFPGTAVIKFMDGYMLGIDPAGRFAFNSAAAEATDYNTLDRWTSEYRPDRLVSMGRAGGDLLLLSANSGEFFQNTGQSPQPFRSRRVFLDKGCAGPFTVAEADSTIFWLGSDGFFYQLEGYSAKRISTRPIEQAIRGQDWWNAFSFVWESQGHTCVGWTFLSGMTILWDCSQQQWHRRESYGFERWRVNCTARTNGQWYAGDFQKGRVWRIDWNYPWEGDTEFVSGFTVPVIHDNQNELIHNRLELVMDTGQPEVEPGDFPGQPDGPSISGDAPDGEEGEPYPGYSYTITPGDAPIASVRIVSGALPPGLTLSNEGVISSGEVDGFGHYSFVVRVTDTNGLWAQVSDSITIPTAFMPVGASTETMSVTELEVELPGETVPGGLLLMQVAAGSSTSVSIITPDGWTLIDGTTWETAAERHFAYSWFYRIADSDTDVTIDASASCGMSAQVWFFPSDSVDTATDPVVELGPEVVGLTAAGPSLSPPWGASDSIVLAAYAILYANTLNVPADWPLPLAQVAQEPGFSGSYMASVGSCANVTAESPIEPGDWVMEGNFSMVAATVAIKAIA